MGKKILMVAGILTVGLSLTACAKTPEEKVVVDKSEGLAKDSIISEEDTPKDLQIPERWQEKIEKSEGFVTLEADYEMQIPEIYNTPVYSFEMNPMTDKRLAELCEYFSEGNKLYEYPRMTKSELSTEKEKIEKYEGKWASWDQGSLFASYLQEKINMMDELIGNAPEETEEYKYIDAGFMAPYQTERDFFDGVSDYYYDTQEEIGFAARVDKGKEVNPIIRAVNYNDKTGSTTNFMYSQGTFIDEAILTQLSYDNADSTEKYSEWINRLNDEISAEPALSKEDALEEVDKIIDDLEIEEMEVTDCVKAMGSENTESWALLEDADLEKEVGYSVYLSRKAEDIVGYNQQSSRTYSELPETVYASYFSVEQLRIIVTEEGIQRFEWTNISNKTGTIADNTKLLSFEKIKGRLADHLLYASLSDGGDKLKEEGSSYSYQVKDIQLRAANINAYNVPASVWLVPVWVFDLERTGITASGEELGWGMETVVLNAIDGGFVTIRSN